MGFITILTAIPWAQVSNLVKVIKSSDRRLIAAVQLLHLCTEIERDDTASGPIAHSPIQISRDIEQIVYGMGNEKWLNKLKAAYQQSLVLRDNKGLANRVNLRG